jgi:hypothetical protein
MKMWRPDSQIPMAKPHAWKLAVQPITNLAWGVERGTVLLISHVISNFKEYIKEEVFCQENQQIGFHQDS